VFGSGTLPLVKNMLLLDGEGKRIALKYFSNDWCVRACVHVRGVSGVAWGCVVCVEVRGGACARVCVCTCVRMHACKRAGVRALALPGGAACVWFRHSSCKGGGCATAAAPLRTHACLHASVHANALAHTHTAV